MKTKEKEVWRDIPGYENYQVSDRGRVRSLNRTIVDSMGRERFFKGRILKGGINKGYRRVKLYINGEGRTLKVSQLAAIAFLSHTPDGHAKVVDHKNGDRSDDRLKNLRIVTNRQNTSTCFRKDSKTLSSVYTGVSWHKRDKKWESKIQYEGKSVYLGCYDDELKASEAYQIALAKIKDGTFNKKFKQEVK